MKSGIQEDQRQVAVFSGEDGMRGRYESSQQVEKLGSVMRKKLVRAPALESDQLGSH